MSCTALRLRADRRVCDQCVADSAGRRDARRRPVLPARPELRSAVRIRPRRHAEEVAQLTDPANWPTDLDAKFFTWIPEFDTGPRPIDGGSDWLPARDRDGSIRADLDRLGVLDNGWISNRTAALLFELRLNNAGFDVTLDEYPGRHTTAEKVLDLVGYMQSSVNQ